MSVYVIIAAGGQGVRAGGPVAKQWVMLGEQSVFARSVEACARVDDVEGLVIAVAHERIDEARRHAEVVARGKTLVVVEGGARRQDSVANAVAALPAEASIVLIHDAARPFVTDAVIRRVVDATRREGAAIAAVAVHDTVKVVDTSGAARIRATLPRESVFLAQTPQGFRRDVLEHVVAVARQAGTVTDEATLAERAGYAVGVVAGDPANVKITTPDELRDAVRRVTERPERREGGVRIGVGYDSHAFEAGRPLKLAGVPVPGAAGLAGHSDGDAVCHAVIDAVLGAAGLGDVGNLFPDTDPTWKDADSLDLLRRAWRKVEAAGYRLGNLDVAIVCRHPKIGPLRVAMAAALAEAVGAEPSQVSLKGKTPEGTPALADALIVHAVALLAVSDGEGSAG